MRSLSQREKPQAFMIPRVAIEPSIFTYDFGVFAGLLIGDGSTQHNNGVRFINTNLELIKLFSELGQKLFGIKKKNMKYYLKIGNHHDPNNVIKQIKCELGLFPETEIKFYLDRKVKSKFGTLQLDFHSKKMADKIKNNLNTDILLAVNNSNFIKGFLQGFMAAEGTVLLLPGKDGERIPHSVQFPQKGTEMLYVIRRYLDLLGVDSRIVIKQKKIDYFCVFITEYKNFKKFLDLGLCDLYEEKRKRLENGVNAYKYKKNPKFMTTIKILDVLRSGAKTRKEINSVLNFDGVYLHQMLHSKHCPMLKYGLAVKYYKGEKQYFELTETGKNWLESYADYLLENKECAKK